MIIGGNAYMKLVERFDGDKFMSSPKVGMPFKLLITLKRENIGRLVISYNL